MRSFRASGRPDAGLFGDHLFESLQVRAEKRFSAGLLVQSNFTWASAFDYATDYLFWNPNIDYGREASFRTKVFNGTYVYELPFGKGKRLLNTSSRAMNVLAGGWQLSGILVWESGLSPLSPAAQQDSEDLSVRERLSGLGYLG